MKQVYMAGNPIEAHIVVDLLGDAGIEAMVRGEHIYAVRGALPIEYPTVWVLHDDDYDRARELALAYERDQTTAEDDEATFGEPWTCPQCGEQVEGRFDQCWNCDTERPTGEQAE
jgi:hypothetical protein